MRKIPEIFLLVFLLFQVAAYSQDDSREKSINLASSILSSRGEAYIAIPSSLRKSFLMEMAGIVPDKQTDSLSFFYIDSEQFNWIRNAGIDFEVLTAPSMLAPVRMTADLDDVLAGEAYPSYQQYLDLMKRFGETYPDLCAIDTIGVSIGGKLILSARIQNGNYTGGERPIVFYSSTMHGDESVGYSLMLMLIDDVLKNAASSPQISTILNEVVLIINPLSNPDGTYFQSDVSLFGAKRYNLNNVDLNRNFPDVRLGMDYSSLGMEKENLAMVKYMEKFPPSLSANFHTGAEVLNYPWDSWYSNERKHADNEWFIEICKDYVQAARISDPSYLRLYPEGYVFGSDWYWIPGGRQDFVTYNLRGRELTIELSDVKLPAVSQIPGLWNKNHNALLILIEKAGDGIFGTITDSLTSEAIGAKVEIPGYDQYESNIFSHSLTGNFFRFLPQGSYELEISAEGYVSKLVEVEVFKNQRTEIGIQLAKIGGEEPSDQGVLVKSSPGNHELFIELKGDGSEVFSADLYDLTGRIVQENIFIGSSGTVGGAMFRGIYILKVKSAQQSVNRLVFL